MNHDERAPNSELDSRVEMDYGLPAFASAGAEAASVEAANAEVPGTAMPSDRLYQVAAMMVGIFLLATLI